MANETDGTKAAAKAKADKAAAAAAEAKAKVEAEAKTKAESEAAATRPAKRAAEEVQDHAPTRAVTHDGEVYEAGDVISLTRVQHAQLFAVGAVAEDWRD